MNEKQANLVYDILIVSCDAPDDDIRFQFVSYVSECVHSREFRFQGCFGFGGKFYMQSHGMRVDGYQEDMTPQLRKRRDSVNKFLDLVFAHFGETDG